MNIVITELKKYKNTLAEFVAYYKRNVKSVNINSFITGEFSIQLGVLLSFLEDNHKIGIHASEASWIVYHVSPYTDIAKAKFERDNTVTIIEYYYNDEDDVSNVLTNFAEAIIETFKYIEEPF